MTLPNLTVDTVGRIDQECSKTVYSPFLTDEARLLPLIPEKFLLIH